MNFSWTRPDGVWKPFTCLLSSELADIDSKLFKAPNFDGGGTYAPSSPVIVSGSGMTLCNLVGTNTVDTAGALEVNGTLSVKPTGHFESVAPAVFWGLTRFNSGGIEVYTNTRFFSPTVTTFDSGTTLSVNGTMTAAFIEVVSVQVTESLYAGPDSVANLNGSLAVGGEAHFYGEVRHHKDTYLDGATVVRGDLTLSGAGAIVGRNVFGANADSTYSVSTVDCVYIAQGSITAPRTYYLDEVGAVNRKKICFHREDDNADRPITLKRSVDGSEITILNWSIGGQIWTDVQRIAGRWQPVGGAFHRT